MFGKIPCLVSNQNQPNLLHIGMVGIVKVAIKELVLIASHLQHNQRLLWSHISETLTYVS